MTEAKLILVMGTDPILLGTRSRVLAYAGLTVVKALTFDEAVSHLTSRRIVLILLCHTLSSEERQGAIAAAHAIDSSIVTFVLGAVAGPCVAMGDVVVHQMMSPQKLVKTVKTLLG